VSAIILIIVLCSRYIWQVFRCKYSKARQKVERKKQENILISRKSSSELK